MKIGLISDTHGSARNFGKVMDGPFADAELILHAGDVLYHGARSHSAQTGGSNDLADSINNLEIPILIARGNCDSEADQAALAVPMMSPYAFGYVVKKRFLLLHGNGYGEKDLDGLVAKFRLTLLVHGHSHIARIRKSGKGLIVNPGTPTIPNPSGPFKKTVAVLDTSKGSVAVQDIETGMVVLEEGFET